MYKRKHCEDDGWWYGEEEEEEELEACRTLSLLLPFESYNRWVLTHWGAKRRRHKSSMKRHMHKESQHLIQNYKKYEVCSNRRSPSTPLDLLCSENDETCATPPTAAAAHQSLPASSSSSKNDVRVMMPRNLNEALRQIQNPQRRRASKKLTNNEWREIRDTMNVENKQLKQEIERLRRLYQENVQKNQLLKAEISLHLDKTHDQKIASTSTFTPVNIDIRENGSCNGYQRINESVLNEHVKNPSFAASTENNRGLGGGNSVIGSQLPSTSGSRSEDIPNPISDTHASCLIDLNVPATECMLETNQNGFTEQILLPVKKAALAAEARRRRIELTRMKFRLR